MTRPIFFYVVFWGDRYRRYVGDILLRSLLAPGNFPRLALADGHKLLACCPDDDWTALRSHPAVASASRFVEFVHVPIAPPPASVHPVEYMAAGHSRAAAVCQAARAYGSLLHPDMLFADGFIDGLQRHIADGVQALLVPALRLAETPLLGRLGVNTELARGEPLVLSPRQVTAAAMESLHDEITECEMDGPRFSTLPNCVWWRNGRRGLLVHSFSWSPLLIDHAAIGNHVLEGLRGPIPDGDYVARNFPKDARIVFVADSDDVAFASWTPAAVGARGRRRSILQNLPVVGRLLRHAILRRAFLHYTRDFYPYGDHVKAKGFKVPLKLHGDDLDESWDALENAAAEEIERAVGDLFDPPIAPVTARTHLLDAMLPLVAGYAVLQQVRFAVRFIARRAIAAVRGDQAAQAWIYSRVRARLGI